MATKKKLMPRDDNNNPIPTMNLSSPHDVDGTNASQQSSVIDGHLVRIAALTDLRFLIGANPTALATSHVLFAGTEIWMPITPGEKVAVLGGKANISTAGV